MGVLAGLAHPRTGARPVSDQVDDIIRRALAEDAPWGDVTSRDASCRHRATAAATLDAREPGVFSGAEVFARVFELVDATTRVEMTARGRSDLRSRRRARARRRRGAVAAAGRAGRAQPGPADVGHRHPDRPLRRGGRRHRARASSTPARPRRACASWSGRRFGDGGGHNHRFSLSDAVLAKDNHLAVLAASGIDLHTAIRDARARLGHTVHLEVEVDRIDQIEPVVSAGVDTIMLDNFTLDAVARRRRARRRPRPRRGQRRREPRHGRRHRPRPASTSSRSAR